MHDPVAVPLETGPFVVRVLFARRSPAPGRGWRPVAATPARAPPAAREPITGAGSGHGVAKSRGPAPGPDADDRPSSAAHCWARGEARLLNHRRRPAPPAEVKINSRGVVEPAVRQRHPVPRRTLSAPRRSRARPSGTATSGSAAEPGAHRARRRTRPAPGPAQLSPDREALEVPGHVLAHLGAARRARRSSRPAARRAGEPSAPPRRASAASGSARPAKASTRSRNSHGRPRQPRPTTTPSAPVRRIMASASPASQMSPLPSTGIDTGCLSAAMASQSASPP